MTKIKVLHIITRLIRGGADENTLRTVYGLDPKVYQVDLLYGLGSEPDGLVDSSRSDINVYHVRELRREITLFSDARALWRLYRLMCSKKYDIVHTHTAKAGIIGRLAAYCAGVPTIIHTLHGATFGDFVSSFKRHLFISLEKFLARWSDKIISVGDDLAARYLEQGIGEKEQYITIRSGMDLKEFTRASSMKEKERIELKQQLGCEPDTLLVGNISRLEERKGHIYFVEAAARLTRYNDKARFLIVGDGPHRSILERAVKRAGVEEQVIFTGFREDVAMVISILDVLVLSSLWEGLPRVLVQGAAVGKPMVTFAVEGAAEVVKEGVNGFIVPVRDVEKMQERIHWMLKNPTEAYDMGMEGRNIVNNDWEVDTMVEQIDKLYQELLAQRD